MGKKSQTQSFPTTELKYMPLTTSVVQGFWPSDWVLSWIPGTVAHTANLTQVQFAALSAERLAGLSADAFIP